MPDFGAPERDRHKLILVNVYDVSRSRVILSGDSRGGLKRGDGLFEA